MKKILLILFFILTLQNFSHADDVRDFQIEGMSIGDSLLDYLNKNEIEESRHATNYKSKKFRTTTLKVPLKLYEVLRVSYKSNDKKYIVHGISGIIKFETKINDCYEKKNEIVNDVKLLFKNIKEKNNIFSHPADSTGKSKATMTTFRFASFDIASVACIAYSKSMKEKRRVDHLRINVSSKEYEKWLVNEAYK